MNKFLMVVSVFLVLTACKGKPSSDRVNPSTIQSFRLSITNSGMVASESPMLVLTEENIRVLQGRGSDSLQFIMPVGYSDTLSRISEVSPIALNTVYSNDCIADGLQLTVILTKGDTTQTVHVNNFYQPQIGLAIEYLNAHVPEKFRIRYDRKQLETDYENCQLKTQKKTD